MRLFWASVFASFLSQSSFLLHHYILVAALRCDCRLNGTLNDSVALMTYMQSFDASHNRLIGNVPQGLFFLSALKTLDLSYNRLTGSLPWTVRWVRMYMQLKQQHFCQRSKLWTCPTTA
jgi:hypothetical protein